MCYTCMHLPTLPAHTPADPGFSAAALAPPARFALDLVEVYFEICHTRIALLSPAQFRAQLRAALAPPLDAVSASASAAVPVPAVHPAILATVLAWGAKFSEHPLIVLDRDADASMARRSRLATSLIRKAREVAEAERVHTEPSADAIIVCVLLDGLNSRTSAPRACPRPPRIDPYRAARPRIRARR